MPGIFPSTNIQQSENNGMAAEPITDSSSLAEETNSLNENEDYSTIRSESNNENQSPTTRPLTQNDEINKKLLASFLERMNNMQNNSNFTSTNNDSSCVELEDKIDDDNSW